jgi:hypothetical protein
MQRELRVFDSFEEAESADLDDWLALSGEQRLRIGESMRLECFPGGALPFVRVLAIREMDAQEE